MRLRIGTRRSRLARSQAAEVAAALAREGCQPELLPMETAGDRSPEASFGTIGAEGVFVRDIQESLRNGRIDVAVHSFKDLPSRTPEDLVIAAVPPRRDAADVLVLRSDAFRPSEPEFPVAPEATISASAILFPFPRVPAVPTMIRFYASASRGPGSRACRRTRREERRRNREIPGSRMQIAGFLR